MTRFCHWPLLTIMFAFVAGCGTGDTRGDVQELSTQDGDTQVAVSARLKVSAEEAAAIDQLRKLGGELDLDDAGHARIVELVKSRATDSDLDLLSRLPRLESLDITGGNVTDAGLKHLRRLKGLQRLYLNDLPITNSALAAIADLTQLDVLSLRNTKIDDEAMAHLKKLSALSVLNLAKTGISNKALRQIQGLTNLDTLVLADTKATGECFVHLKPLRKLRVLNVDRCQDLDGYLMDLSGLSELRMLYVYDCTVSEDEVEELSDQNSRLAVFGD